MKKPDESNQNKIKMMGMLEQRFKQPQPEIETKSVENNEDDDEDFTKARDKRSKTMHLKVSNLV